MTKASFFEEFEHRTGCECLRVENRGTHLYLSWSRRGSNLDFGENIPRLTASVYSAAHFWDMVEVVRIVLGRKECVPHGRYWLLQHYKKYAPWMKGVIQKLKARIDNIKEE